MIICWIGAAIGAAAGIAGSIFGALSASRAMKKARENIKAQRDANANWAERYMTEDATQSASAQRVLSKLQEQGIRNNRNVAGAAAVMGGTQESVAAAKEANNATMADAASQIAAQGDRRRDLVEQQYLQREQTLDDQLTQMEINRGAQTAQATQGLVGAAGNIGDVIDDIYEPRNQNKS